MTTDLRADAARNRERILEVARRRVADGDLALPMNALAAEAGVGVGTAYRHFGDRATLLAALAQPGLAGLEAEVRAASQDPDARGGLARVMHAALRIVVEDRAVAEVVRGGAGADTEVAALVTRTAEALGALVDRSRADGGPDLRADDVRRLLCGVEHAARLGDDPARDAERYLDLLLPGLRGA